MTKLRQRNTFEVLSGCCMGIAKFKIIQLSVSNTNELPNYRLS